MNLKEMVDALGLEVLTAEGMAADGPDLEGGYASDLLSDVLAHAPQHGVLVTVQVHMNVVAVSVHAGLAGVIFALGRKPDAAAQARAAEEGIALFASEEPAFDLVGKLYALGLRGSV